MRPKNSQALLEEPCTWPPGDGLFFTTDACSISLPPHEARDQDVQGVAEVPEAPAAIEEVVHRGPRVPFHTGVRLNFKNAGLKMNQTTGTNVHEFQFCLDTHPRRRPRTVRGNRARVLHTSANGPSHTQPAEAQASARVTLPLQNWCHTTNRFQKQNSKKGIIILPRIKPHTELTVFKIKT